MSTPQDQYLPFLEGMGERSPLDRLFEDTRRYRTSQEFRDVLAFAKRFHTYAPYNCFLLHMQRPDAKYVANASHWKKIYNRTVVPGARPLIVLRPFGPVDFVYDVSDTEGDPVPDAIDDFFGASGMLDQRLWLQTRKNCAREFIALHEAKLAANAAGSISTAAEDVWVDVLLKRDRNGTEVWERRAAKYRLTINSSHQLPTQYATLVHELAHLYCGHLGTPNDKWWPDRRHLLLETREFEAESVSWLVCERIGITNPSARYLDGYLTAGRDIPLISLELVLKVAGHIERMGVELLKLRQEK